MIIVMNQNATKREIESVEHKLSELGFRTHPIVGEFKQSSAQSETKDC